MERYTTIKETLEYRTATDETNAPEAILIAGSQNCLIDQQRKVKSRSGYTRLGSANASATPVRASATWNNSTGGELPIRQYDDELEVYLGTVGTTVVNAWTRVASSFNTTEIMDFALWWKDAENLDVLLFTIGDSSMREWGGGVFTVSSVDSGTLFTKTGTNTFAQDRIFTAANKTLVCVRTGTEYTYSAGESSTQLTVTDTTGLIAGDILVQKIITTASSPVSGRNNDAIFVNDNQLYVASNEANEVYVSKNTDRTSFTFSTPRLSGEGAILTLDNPAQAFGALGSTTVIFAGRSSIYQTEFEQITVGSTLSETMKVKKLDTGIDQSAQNNKVVVPIGNALAYLSYEPALRIITSPDTLTGIDPKAYSNPIKPDFDEEDWSNAEMEWYKNALHLTAPNNSRLYILEFVEDADGKTRRFWQPPQILPVRCLSIIDGALHGHSNGSPETYRLFYGNSDGEYAGMEPAEKFPIPVIMKFAYRTFKERNLLKNFDLYFVEGQITQNTTISSELLYDFGGSTQTVTTEIDGSNADIVYEDESLSSLGQSSLGTQPLGGSSVEPDDTLRFNTEIEIAKEDFLMVQETFTMDGIVDGYFSIIARGMNAKLSPRRNYGNRL